MADKNPLYIMESRIPMTRHKITVSKMDLIRENYQSSDEEPEMIAIPEEPEPLPEEEEPEVIIIPDEPEPLPVPFEMLTPREKKQVFRQELVNFPKTGIEKYRCNWCPELISRGSVQRHVRTVHPDRFGGDWRDHCTPSDRPLVPILKTLSTEMDDNQRIKVKAHVSWSRSRLKVHPLEDVIGSRSIREGLNHLGNNGPRPQRMLIGSDEVQNMYDLWRAAKNEGGKYGLAMQPTECAICLVTNPNVNKSVFYHWDYPRNDLHKFCTTCIQTSVTMSDRCPLCNETGFPVRLYHAK